MIIVCLTCNITLPRRQGSRADGARSSSVNIYTTHQSDSTTITSGGLRVGVASYSRLRWTLVLN